MGSLLYTGAFSHSAFDQYDTCPQQFAFRRILRLGQAVGEPLDVGNGIHTLAELYGRHCFEAKRLDDPDRLAELARGVRAELTDEAAVDFDTIADRLLEVPFDPNVMRDAEFELELAWNERWEPCEWFADDVFYRAKIDVIHREDAMGVVTDWKTQRRIPPKSEIEKSFQLRSYAWAGAQVRPEIQEWLARAVFLRYGNAAREVRFTAEDLATVRNQIEVKADYIRRDRAFKPRISDACLNCDYAGRCPAFKKLYGEPGEVRIESAETAVAAANELVVIRRRQKDLEQRLRVWVDEHGAVPVGEKVLGYRALPSIDFDDPKAVGNTLAEIGVDRETVWLALTATKTSVENALKAAGFKGKKRDEALLQVAAKAGRIGTNTRFELHEPKGDE
jgi:hypothetical protein